MNTQIEKTVKWLICQSCLWKPSLDEDNLFLDNDILSIAIHTLDMVSESYRLMITELFR